VGFLPNFTGFWGVLDIYDELWYFNQHGDASLWRRKRIQKVWILFEMRRTPGHLDFIDEFSAVGNVCVSKWDEFPPKTSKQFPIFELVQNSWIFFETTPSPKDINYKTITVVDGSFLCGARCSHCGSVAWCDIYLRRGGSGNMSFHDWEGMEWW